MAKFNTSGKKSNAKSNGLFDTVNDTMEGFEEISQATMAIPFIRILQKLSPQLNKQEPGFIDGAEEGHFVNTITKQVLGSSFKCIVLKFEHIYIEWRPKRGGFVSYHAVENAERLAVEKTFGKWKTEEGNLLQENYVYLILVEHFENEGVAVFSLSSSMIKTAREWNRLMTSHMMDNGKKAMPYYLVWELQTEYKSNEKGSWYTPTVKFSRYIGPEQYKITQKERKILPSRQIDYAQLESATAKSDELETEEAF